MRSLSLTICAALFAPKSSQAFHHHSRIMGTTATRPLSSHDFSSSPSSSTTKLHASSSSSSSSSSALPPTLRLDTDGSEHSSSDDVITARLANKRVAYYFAAGWCPMCTRFEPSLLQFRDAANESGKPIEIIYVPSDRTKVDAETRASAMNMLSVPFFEQKDDVDSTNVADDLKKKYEVWAGSEALKLGFGRRSGVPALVVLNGKTGEELSFVAAESQGVNALATWPLDDENSVWEG